MFPSEGDPELDRKLSSYDFDLPAECIAQTPAEPRHAARLLVVDPPPSQQDPSTVPPPTPGEPPGVRHLRVWDLCEELRSADLLVVNDTRVLKARLTVRRPSGGKVELLVLERWRSAGDEVETAEGGCLWLCLARPARRLHPGERLRLEAPGAPELLLEVVRRDEASGGRVVRFPDSCTSPETIEGLLDRYGTLPLPPYIRGHREEDEQRYQTRFASRPGAVAAPTAGLHLSDELLDSLSRRGIQVARVTLHVGLGTFRPLEGEDLSTLELHSEWVEVSPQLVGAVEACRARGGRVMAVGTTSVRSLEGVAALHGGVLKPYRGRVNLVIQPGFRFSVVQGLLTNFHLPRSSLLLLVSALIGRARLLEIYELAKSQGYRFFSYGDAMWIPPEAVLPSARPL